MENFLKLNPLKLTEIRRVDERLVSYNIEMTEVTGGTFWKSYTPGQIAGTEEFRLSGSLTDFTVMPELMQHYPPIDLCEYCRRRYEQAGIPRRWQNTAVG